MLKIIESSFFRFFVIESFVSFFLEINTVPGQSEASIVPQQVRAKGMTLVDFYGNLIEECIKK
jgi:D-alanine-D-alanine ligase-like ATP-grasp enzyme